MAPHFRRAKTWCYERKGLETLKNHLRRKNLQTRKSPLFPTWPQLKKQQIWELRQFWSEKAQRISSPHPNPGLKMQQLLEVMLWCSTCPECWIQKQAMKLWADRPGKPWNGGPGTSVPKGKTQEGWTALSPLQPSDSTSLILPYTYFLWVQGVGTKCIWGALWEQISDAPLLTFT